MRMKTKRLQSLLLAVTLVFCLLLGSVCPAEVYASGQGGMITVSFRLIGSEQTDGRMVDMKSSAYRPDYVTWIPTTTYTLQEGSTVHTLFTQALKAAGLAQNGADSGYVRSINAPQVLGGYTLGEFTNGVYSGWMYTVNGEHPDVGLKDCVLEDGAQVVWHYVNDYRYEVEDWSSGSLGNASTWNPWTQAPDTEPKAPAVPEEPQPQPTPSRPETGSVHQVSKVQYKILSSTKASVYRLTDKSVKSLSVKEKVTIDGYSFTVTTVGSAAFKNCTKLQTVTLPKTVTTLGSEAFSGCTALKTVKGASGLTTVNKKAFYNCKKLSTVGSKSGTVTLSKVKTIGSSAFYNCAALKKVNVSSTSLTKIDTGAFGKCTAMTTFTASSKKLTSIGKQAFYNCKKLANVTLKTEKLTKSKVGSNAFKGIKSTCKFKVPSKKVSSYQSILKSRGAGTKIKVTK